MMDKSNVHIVKQFEEELQTIKDGVVSLGALVDNMIDSAMRALETRDVKLAKETIEKDRTVNNLEVEIDDLCITTLALRQPTASDLRLITTVMKVISDLERMGDMGVNIAERAIGLAEEKGLTISPEIYQMEKHARKMLKECIQAFIEYDTELASKVLKNDDIVDNLNRQALKKNLEEMIRNPTEIERDMQLGFIPRYLERVADHATNIAEMVIFMVKGKVVRHMKVF